MKSTILYVEDNPDNRELMQIFMEDQPYILLDAQDCMSANGILRSANIDLILMDVNLPHIDGLEFTRSIRANPETAHIPIIAVTADVMAGDRCRCLEAGCDDYVAKPVMRIELFNKIRFALQSKDRISA